MDSLAQARRHALVGLAIGVCVMLSGCKDEAVCADVDCGQHGACMSSGGAAACDCDDGYHAEGQTCVQDDLPPVNHAPEITNLPASQDGQLGVATSFPIVASDADGDPISWRVVSTTCGFAPAVDGSGVVTWTCDTAGDCTVDVEVADDFAPPATDQGTLTIGCYQSVPVFETAPTTTVVEHVAYVYAVSCADPTSLPVTLALGANDDCGGTLESGNGGSAVYTFTPDEAAGGTSCTLELSCSNGEATVIQTAVIQVLETNEQPAITSLPANATVHWGTAGSHTITATDTDVPANTLISAVVSNDCDFMPTLDSANMLQWTCGDMATCTVTVRVSDDGSPALDDEEMLTIECDNTAPGFSSTPGSLGEQGTPYEYTATCQDADGDPLTLVRGAADTCDGTVLDQGNGVASYLFTPTAAGPCILVIGCSDSQQTTLQQATVSVTGTPGGEPTVFSGSNFNCARRANDTLACWGCNSYSEVDPPAQVFDEIALGEHHGCGLTASQTIVCWGRNTDGQTNAPTGTFIALDAGTQTTCAIDTTGALQCWGANYYNMIAQMPTTTGWTQISVGSTHACAKTAAGLVTCWGDNSRDQLDVPPATLFTKVEAGSYGTCGLTTLGNLLCWGLITGLGGSPDDFVLTNSHGCALDAGGVLSCWGSNWYNQLNVTANPVLEVTVGYGHTCYRETNGTLVCLGYNLCSQAIAPNQPFTDLVGGFDFFCGLDPIGEILCWGYDSDGKLNPPAGSFESLGLAVGHACALRADQTMACWGNNDYGQSSAQAGTYLQVDGGQRHTCALTTTNTLQCWGNGVGRQNVPTGTYNSFVSGSWHNCALTATGVVDCWGSDTDGQSTPVAGAYTKLGAGIFHTCGLKTDSTLACWGRAQDGMIAVPAGTYLDLAVGATWACALDTAGFPVCWGANNNDVTVPPAGWGPFEAIRAGQYTTCARDGNQDWWCWGRSRRQPI